MFGYDDDGLNDILMKLAKDPTVTMLVTLDKSQAGGKHEKALLDADKAENLTAFNTHVVVRQSETHQISHTKASWRMARSRAKARRTGPHRAKAKFVVPGKAGGARYKAQNNTQSIITDPDTISRFSAELISKHFIAQKQSAGV
jgi:hypothetical protein